MYKWHVEVTLAWVCEKMSEGFMMEDVTDAKKANTDVVQQVEFDDVNKENMDDLLELHWKN